jgi:hypothetical protein
MTNAALEELMSTVREVAMDALLKVRPVAIVHSYQPTDTTYTICGCTDCLGLMHKA